MVAISAYTDTCKLAFPTTSRRSVFAACEKRSTLCTSRYQIFTAQVSVLISEMKIWIEDQNSHSVICCMAAHKSRSFYIRFMLLMLHCKGTIVVCRRYMAVFQTHLKTIEYASRSYPFTPTNSIIERRHSAESILGHPLKFSILEGIAA